MTKETVVAIFIGFGLGALVAGGFFFFPKVMKPSPLGNSSPFATPAATPSPAVENTVALKITEPLEGAIVDDTVATISGTSVPNAVVVVVGPQSDRSLTADSVGTFSSELPLSDGINEFTITVFSPQGNSQTQVRTIAKKYTAKAQ